MPDNTPMPEIETFTWRGQTRYKCPLNWESGAKCQYNTAAREELVQHMAKGGHTREAHKNVVENTAPSAHITTEPVKPEFEKLQFADGDDYPQDPTS